MTWVEAVKLSPAKSPRPGGTWSFETNFISKLHFDKQIRILAEKTHSFPSSEDLMSYRLISLG